jgi:biotin carboxyl carrier protein
MMKQYTLTINGKTYDVRIDSIRDGKADVTVNGTPCRVELPSEKAEPEPVARPRKARQTPVPAPVRKKEPTAAGAASDVVAPMSGIIKEIFVREGQEVSRGDRVAILEAMKMENDLLAGCDGNVTGIYVSKGDTVSDGAPILTIR